jgi:hypothetical protein
MILNPQLSFLFVAIVTCSPIFETSIASVEAPLIERLVIWILSVRGINPKMGPLLEKVDICFWYLMI